MHFDLADLRLFIHIAESPSLTQGAKRAFLSPAAASARIKALESQLETRLLYRDSRGVEVTPAGERLLQHARLIMRQVDYLKSEFTQYGGDSTGHMRIFANTTAVTEFLPEILAGFLSKRPGSRWTCRNACPATSCVACSTAPPTWASSPARWRPAACRSCISAPTTWC